MITFYYKALDIDVELPEDPPWILDILMASAKLSKKKMLSYLLKQGCIIKQHDPEAKGYNINYLTLKNHFTLDLKVGFFENDDCKDTKIEFIKEVCDFVGNKISTEELEKLADRFNTIRLLYCV